MSFENWTIEKSKLILPTSFIDEDDEREKMAAYEAAIAEYQQVANWCNESGEYHIEDKGDFYAVEKNAEPTPEELKQREIAELKAKLAATDYVVIKIAEGSATPEEYADIIEQRRQWRERINELEGNNEDLAESEAENGELA